MALLLLGTVATVAWLSVASASRALLPGRAHLLASLELADLDRQLREAAGRVRFPLWQAPSLDLAWEARGVRVPYLDGSPDSSLELRSSAGGTSILLPEGERRYSRLELRAISAATGPDGGLWGLELAVGPEGGEAHRLVVSFGALPW